MALFFTNQTTNASSAAQEWSGGIGTYFAQGTFDGATVTLEASFDNGVTWIALPNGGFTSKTAINFQLQNARLRATLSNAGATTSITAGI